MEKRLLAVLIAALAGSAYGQTVTNGASGQPVSGGYGQPVTGAYGAGTAASAPTAPAARTQLAQSTNPAPAPRRTANEVAGTTGTNGNPPPAPGYVGSGAGVVATNPYGLCWRMGADWTPDKAAAPCDTVPRAAAAPVPYVAEAPKPEPAPAPLAAAPAPAPTVLEKITLNTDVLFEFNKAELRPSGQQKLDDLATKAKDANVDRIVLTGHADRIGSEQYNQELSEKRAQAVADYLQSKGIDNSKLQVAGKGESEPVTGSDCAKLGKDNNKNPKLIACLQPDRRVDAELLGSREQTASTPSSTPSAAGATSGSSSTSGSASGSSSSTTNK